MKHWKYRRMVYYSQGITSDINGLDVRYETEREKVIERAIEYFNKYDNSGVLYYPAKSYAVAIIYADLLAETFGGKFDNYLYDPELLDRDDHFVPYLRDPETYEIILNEIDIENIDYSLPNVAATKRYFREEFLLDDHRSLFEHTG